MARRQAADYEEKRGAIIDAAARLFADKGFDGASLADLAEACQTSKSLIYHYYASKEEILHDLMSRHMNELLAEIDEGALAGAPGAALKAFARGLMRKYSGAAARQKVLLYDLARLPATLRDDIIAKERRLVAHAEAIIAGAAPAGADRARLRAAAMLFFGMLNWTPNWFRPSGAMSRDELADLAAATILNAYS
jgi:AcrR family transcriptional regulator